MSSMKGSLPFLVGWGCLDHRPTLRLALVPVRPAADVLQACVRQEGFRADVLYANIMLASFIGEQYYEKIAAESVLWPRSVSSPDMHSASLPWATPLSVYSTRCGPMAGAGRAISRTCSGRRSGDPRCREAHQV